MDGMIGAAGDRESGCIIRDVITITSASLVMMGRKNAGALALGFLGSTGLATARGAGVRDRNVDSLVRTTQ